MNWKRKRLGTFTFQVFQQNLISLKGCNTMPSLLLQPNPHFARIDSQYQSYLVSILSPSAVRGLQFFVDKHDHQNDIKCPTDTTIVKDLCLHLGIKDADNCRKIIRELLKLDLVKRITDKHYILNPSYCNRVQYLWPGAMHGFKNVKDAVDFVRWKITDDQNFDKYPSLRKRLSNAVFFMEQQTNQYAHERDIEMNELKQKLAEMEIRLKQLETTTEYLMGHAEPEHEEKAKVMLRIVK